MDLVRSLGADHVVDYRTDDVTTGPELFDVILDTGGNRRIADLRRILTPTGRLVIIGAETGGRILGGVDRQLRATMLSPFVSQHLGTFISSENQADLVALAQLIESGLVTPVIDRTFPLAEAPAAIDYLLAGNARGKVVVTV